MTANNKTISRRKRGGQPGNSNALKHGFYSRRFCDLERRDLDASLDDDLRSEAAMLRVQIRRVFDLAADVDDVEQASSLLRILALSVGRLAGLLRVQALYGLSAADDYGRTLNEALTELMDELSLKV